MFTFESEAREVIETIQLVLFQPPQDSEESADDRVTGGRYYALKMISMDLTTAWMAQEGQWPGGDFTGATARYLGTSSKYSDAHAMGHHLSDAEFYILSYASWKDEEFLRDYIREVVPTLTSEEWLQVILHFRSTARLAAVCTEVLGAEKFDKILDKHTGWHAEFRLEEIKRVQASIKKED